MILRPELLLSVERILVRYCYGTTYDIPPHRHLARIVPVYFGCNDIYAFMAEARRRQIAARPSRSAPGVEVMGGSSDGADLSHGRVKRLFGDALAAAGIRHAILLLHFGRSGRLDFHLLLLGFDEEGRTFRQCRLVSRLKAALRDLVSALNEERLDAGRPSIANTTPRGKVFYVRRHLEVPLDQPGRPPSIESTTGAPTPAEPTLQAAPTEPNREGITETHRPAPQPDQARTHAQAEETRPHEERLPDNAAAGSTAHKRTKKEEEENAEKQKKLEQLRRLFFLEELWKTVRQHRRRGDFAAAAKALMPVADEAKKLGHPILADCEKEIREVIKTGHEVEDADSYIASAIPYLDALEAQGRANCGKTTLQSEPAPAPPQREAGQIPLPAL